MYVFESDLYLNQLTKQEEKARDIMVYLFNPVLKYILAESKPEEFAKYGFNSCRQTAILGAAYLQKLLPDYNIVPYEGTFIEYLSNGFEQYVHAFILANKYDRRLLIDLSNVIILSIIGTISSAVDLSRTSKRLMFHEAPTFLYPSIKDYKNMILINKNPINLDEMINTNIKEYFTNKKPTELLELIETLINYLQTKTQEEKDKFCDIIYSSFTQLRR